ncbi:MAG: hypothetical protein P1P93_02910 [Gammaproteobacteria bacterium]|nr:hypothetical protein [Gammaproteobacteria bacterium]
MTEHRLGINPGFLTKHRLNLAGLDQADSKAMIAEIDAQPWVDRVCLNKQTLIIAYEASRHNIDELIAIIEKYGASIKDSWWSRTKLGWQRQTDENIKNNARHEPHCCNKIPSGNRFRH